MLPGGKIQQNETSINAIKREIEEETGYNNLEYKLIGITEKFVNAKGFDNHQVTLIFETINNEIDNYDDFKLIETDWINFKWIDIHELNQYTIFPKKINKLLDNNNFIHLIDKTNSN